MTAEFNLIQKYFTKPTAQTDLGIGDDAALIRCKEGYQLAISTDMSVVCTHFFEDTAPYNIGWKALAVNVSDMAAMGAQPKWATLSIALPNADESWIAEFSRGLFDCAQAFNIDLIGGDTTRGPLNISIQILGETPTNQALIRGGATAGDDIWVSGNLGNAALGLAHLMQSQAKKSAPKENQILSDDTLAQCLKALHTPQPRVALGLALRGLANSCIDISDGLLADLNHILEQSSATVQKLGAAIELDQIPCLSAFKNNLEQVNIQQAILAGDQVHYQSH